MHRDRWILVLGSLLVAAACGGPGDAQPARPAAVNDSPLIATLKTDRPVYPPGEPITFELTLRNSGAASQILEFSSAQRYDFTIEDAHAPVWRWSANQVFAQMLGEETLSSGDSVVYRELFRGQLAAGSYRGVGTITRIGDAIAAAAEFQVR